jgi:NADP-dependent 3-hydroxy acid dehydrogenase YdfG
MSVAAGGGSEDDATREPHAQPHRGSRCARLAASGTLLRTTSISPGFVRTELVDDIDDLEQREQAQQAMAALGISPDAVARAIAFVIEQPDDVEIGDMTIRPARQS